MSGTQHMHKHSWGRSKIISLSSLFSGDHLILISLRKEKSSGRKPPYLPPPNLPFHQHPVSGYQGETLLSCKVCPLVPPPLSCTRTSPLNFPLLSLVSSCFPFLLLLLVSTCTIVFLAWNIKTSKLIKKDSLFNHFSIFLLPLKQNSSKKSTLLIVFTSWPASPARPPLGHFHWDSFVKVMMPSTFTFHTSAALDTLTYSSIGNTFFTWLLGHHFPPLYPISSSSHVCQPFAMIRV